MNTAEPYPVLRPLHRWTLALCSGLMLAGAFPPSPVHSFAFVALIPLLFLVETAAGTWQILRYSYITFFVFHAATLFWIGGFVVGKDLWMMIAGAAVLVVHPLFYVAVMALYLLMRKRLGILVALIFLPFVWTAYEYSHSLGEFSFPWITLGNSQAYDLPRIQMASVTSVYGISFFILAFNVLGFVLLAKLATRSWQIRSRPSLTTLALLAFIYLGPWVYGKIVMTSVGSDDTPDAIHVGIVQPNIDPWEKWGSQGSARRASYDRQMELYVRETKSFAGSETDLIIWPETAIPFRVLLPENQPYFSWLRTNLDSVNIPVLTGLPYTIFYDSVSAPVTSSKDPFRNRFYDDFNSVALFAPGQPVWPIHRKIVLVPFAERIPYAEALKFLIEPLKWNVGIGMWGKGTDTVLFQATTKNGSHVSFASLICYESVYPNFVREYVSRGANFLVIVTNDSWWGNTPGAYQHAAYASLRAVENRRWIVRVANGGISGLIDPTGTYHQATELYTAATIRGSLYPRTDATFYSNHGDLFAQGCSTIAAVFVFFALLSQRRKTSHAIDSNN